MIRQLVPHADLLKCLCIWKDVARIYFVDNA